MQKTILQTVLICLFAFIGGVFSDQFLGVRESRADVVPDLLSAEAINLGEVYKDRKKQKRILLDASQGAPIQEFYGLNGKQRLIIGTYQGDESVAGDAGLPQISLMDPHGQLKMLLRVTQGKNKSPVMVLKDSQGNDRMIMGLAINAEGEEPFLAYFDRNGGKHLVFGNY